MIHNAILDRINDENPIVVIATLGSFKKKLFEIMDHDVLKEALIKVLVKSQCNKETYWKVSYAALDILCSYYEYDVQTLLAILPFLLPTTMDEMKPAQQIINSSYINRCEMLKSLKDKLLKATTNEKFFAIVYDGLSMNEHSLDLVTVVETLKKVPKENHNALHEYLAMLLLSSLLPENSPADVSDSILDIFLMFLEHSKVQLVKREPTASNFLASARKGKLPLQGVLHCINNLILKTQVPDKKIGILDFCVQDNTNKFHLNLLKILLTGCSSSKVQVSVYHLKSLKVYFKHFCVDFIRIIECYLNLAVTNYANVDFNVQLQCLNIVQRLLTEEQENLTSFANFENVVVPYLTVALSNPNAEYRNIAVDILQVLVNILGPKLTNCYVPLLIGLLDHKEEILLDHEQLSFVLCNLLSSSKKGVGRAFSKILDAFINVIHNLDYPGYLRSSLLKVLIGIDDINSFVKMSSIAVSILRDCDPSTELNKVQDDFVYRILKRFDSNVAENIDVNTDAWHLIELALKNDFTRLLCDDVDQTCPAGIVLNQIDQEFFSNLKINMQTAFLSLVTDLAIKTPNPSVSQALSRVFRRIDLDLTLVVEYFKSMRDVQSPKQMHVKRRRISVIPTVDIIDTNEWKKGITILEFIQDKKKIRNVTVLLPLLFDILKKCLDFDEQNCVEYPKQLLLSSILHFCTKVENEKLPESMFNVELVVQCIRASQNPQTHHHALLLLAHAAPLVPDQVLHHIIAVFTFMGSSVLRHDDAYSFQIITKIIDTIIPILLQDRSIENIANVLRIFVDAIIDIPEHRRMPLFKLLLTLLDPEENLHIFLLLVFEAHVVHGHTEKKKVNHPLGDRLDEAPKRLDISANLCREFSPDIVLNTCVKLFKYLRQLPEEKNDYVTDGSPCYTFNIQHHNPKQFRHYKYTLVTFVANLLASKEFVVQVASLSDSSMQELEGIFKNLIVNVLTYIQSISKTADKSVSTPQAQYWKIMLHHSYDTLDSINALVTSQMFLLVIKGLMVHSLYTVRRRALELLNAKLQGDSSFFTECEQSEIFALIPPLVNIIKTVESDHLDPEQELIIQTALLSLKLLVKEFAFNNVEKFVQLLDFIADLVKSGISQENILASVILCLAELCSSLRAHAISSLNKFMPAIIKLLKKLKHQMSPNLLLLSILTALHKILNTLPLFLSPYLEKLLHELSCLISTWDLNTQDQKLAPFVNKLVTLRQKIGDLIPARVLIPAVESCYTSLVNKDKFKAVSALLDILSENLGNLRGPQLQANLPALTTFFLNALQFRADCNCDFEQANDVESHIVRAMVTMVLKLSESSFRPLYYKLFDWAIRTDVKSERIITFYNLSSGIANCLKGLFILFAGHFVNNAAALLDACNVSKSQELYFTDDDKNMLLLENILQTLHAVFLHDSQKFINKERFDVLMQPLVDQLENTLGGNEKYENRAKTIVVPCIVQFAIATADDSLWKQLNYQILVKTRNDSANIRLIALECLKELARKLGDDFLPLLPETIPFLAELLEDEEETVEKSCRKTVQELEKVFGESLQKYF